MNVVHRPRFAVKNWRLLAGGLLVLLLIAELALRARGLGSTPLVVLDESIQYYPKPGTTHRFGNEISVNSAHMRGPEFGAKQGLRVLLIGDSIVHGTFHIDQSETIGAHLQRELERITAQPVEVLNVACASWGPVNQDAFIRRFGTFDADVAAWVLSSHDLVDAPVPGEAELLPVRQPLLALEDALWLARRRFAHFPPTNDAEARTRRAISSMIARLNDDHIPLLVVHHSSRGELRRGKPDEAGLTLMGIFEQKALPVLHLGQVLGTLPAPAQAFEDELHLGPLGARTAGTALATRLHSVLKTHPLRPGSPPARQDEGTPPR